MGYRSRSWLPFSRSSSSPPTVAARRVTAATLSWQTDRTSTSTCRAGRPSVRRVESAAPCALPLAFTLRKLAVEAALH